MNIQITLTEQQLFYSTVAIVWAILGIISVVIFRQVGLEEKDDKDYKDDGSVEFALALAFLLGFIATPVYLIGYTMYLFGKLLSIGLNKKDK